MLFLLVLATASVWESNLLYVGSKCKEAPVEVKMTLLENCEESKCSAASQAISVEVTTHEQWY
jgi:hypothetical protein